MTEPLSMWTVYARPRDYPDKFVARRFEIRAGEVRATSDLRLAESLAALRVELPEGLCRLVRQDGDDAVIVETWV